MFDFAYRYFSFNDLGNLLGRVAHKFGAKFGHAGLLYPLRDPENSDHLIDELLITRDFGEALALLGYDPQAYEAALAGDGFATLEDVFRFVVNSPYVNRDIYLLENRNHASRTRDAKRRTYRLFLEWLEERGDDGLPAFPWAASGTVERDAQRAAFLARAFARNPQFERDYAAALAVHARRQAAKRFFNGELIGQRTGASGRALGECMRRLRHSFSSNEELECFFATASEADALARIDAVLCLPEE